MVARTTWRPHPDRLSLQCDDLSRTHKLCSGEACNSVTRVVVNTVSPAQRKGCSLVKRRCVSDKVVEYNVGELSEDCGAAAGCWPPLALSTVTTALYTGGPPVHLSIRAGR